jgi:DUF1680 family protein
MIRTYRKFRELPLSAIEPESWLRRYLEKQRAGLTGHLDEAGYPFNTKGWASPKVVSRGSAHWWPYEQTAYWIDGMTRAGYLLRDDFLIQKARQQLDYVLDHAGRDGYLGPVFMRDAAGQNRWPHAVLFRAYMALYGATGDERIPRALSRHYLSGTGAHSEERNVCNVEAMLWTYEQTGDRRLLDEALETYEQYNRLFAERDTNVANMLSPRRATEHGVTYNEIAKLAALVAIYTGRQRYLAAAVNAYRKIDRFHMLVDGVCSSSEHLKGRDPLDTHETCDIADYAWSVGYLLMATGQAEYADKIERACFNAAPGAVKSDFKALQYFSCPNQVLADRSSNHNLYECGRSWMAYRPNHDCECCPGEVHRVMPNFAARMWMSDGAGGLVAALYGPSRITAAVGTRGAKITVVEETDYPFRDRIEFQIRTARPVAFPFWVRIPGWCTSAQVFVNGERLTRRLQPGTFVKIARTFRHNDRVSVCLPMKLHLSHWPRGGIAVERGPLVYALRVEEDWRLSPIKEKCSPRFPAWDLYPASPWNYALALDEENLERGVEVHERPLAGDPWSIDTAPVVLRVPARRVAGWRIRQLRAILHQYNGPAGAVTERRKGAFRFTPQLPAAETLPRRLSQRLETVTLVPYGCTHLRITVFPQCK